MSLDRYGCKIMVGWSEVEKQWLEAALTLPKSERTDAYRDIAYMSARPMLSVQRMAWRVAMFKRDEEVKRSRIAPRPVKRAEPLAPSQIAPPSQARLMSGRASRSATTGVR